MTSRTEQRVRGWREPDQRLAHGIRAAGRAMLAATIELPLPAERKRRRIRFMLDTGADVTLLSPTDAYRLLEEEYLNLDFDHDPYRISLFGAAGGGAVCIVRNARYGFRTDSGVHLWIAAPILITAPPRSDVPPDREPRIPSLLGRDLQRRFSIQLEHGEAPLVLLSTST